MQTAIRELLLKTATTFILSAVVVCALWFGLRALVVWWASFTGRL